MVQTDQGILTPYPVCIHNLNHVSVFPLTLRLSCLPLCWPVLAYSSLTPYLTRCVDLSTYVILSFCDFHSCLLSSRTNHFLSFLPKFFSISPPPCLVSHFSLFTLLFTLPDFLQQLASPACLHFVSLCGLCFFAAVRVSRTEGESVRFCPPLSLTAPYPNAENKQVQPIPGYIRSKR